MNGLVKPGDPAKGILRMEAGLDHFELKRQQPAVALLPWIDSYWSVEWNLGEQQFSQENIPHPSVNLSFENSGTGFLPFLTGIWPRNYLRHLTGTGRVFGVKFRPAMFRAWWQIPVGSLTGQVVALPSFRGFGLAPLCQEFGSMEPKFAFGELDHILRGLVPPPDPQGEAIRDLIDLMQTDRSIQTTIEVAERLGVDVRTAQRLFLAWVGVGPKWIIMRYRIHDAIDRLGGGTASLDIDLGNLALDLGYWDQAHFTHEFVRMTGQTPDAYRRKKWQQV